MSGKNPEFFHVSVDLVSCKALPKEVFLIFQHYGYENRGTFFELIAAPGVTSGSLKEEISAHLGSADRVYVRGFPTHQLPEGLVSLVRREHYRQKHEEDRRRKKRITKKHSAIVLLASKCRFVPYELFSSLPWDSIADLKSTAAKQAPIIEEQNRKTSALPLKHKPRKSRK